MKRTLLCILLSLLLLLGSCALAEENPVLFTFENREVRQSEVLRRAQGYAEAGLISSESAVMEAIDYMIRNQLVPEAKAAELGLDQYTQEELARIKAEADAYYEQQLDAYIAYFAAGFPEAEQKEFRQALREYWEEIGSTVEAAEETHLFNQTSARLLETMEISVSEKEIQQVFAEQTAKDEAYFKENYRAYEYYTYYMHNDIWYVPEGFREMLDLRFAAAADDPLAEHADAIAAVRAQLAEGVAFADVSVPAGATLSTIYVHEGSTLYSDALVKAAFSEAMREAGAVSEAFADEKGAHLLCTVGELPSGTVALDDRIRESITNYLINRKRSEILAGWAAEYQVTYNRPAIDALIASLSQ